MTEHDDICPFCGDACGHWEAAEAEIKRQTDAADAAAEVVGSMAEKLSAMLAERDRLRAVVGPARMVLAGIEWGRTAGGVLESIPINRLADLKRALDVLDGSGIIGGAGET